MFPILILPPSQSPSFISNPNHHYPNKLHYYPPLRLVRPASSRSTTHLPFCAKVGHVISSMPTSVDSEGFPVCLQQGVMPRHVAFILDGNRRWAKLRGLHSEVGHDQMVNPLLEVMGLCVKWGIQVATFFSFSTENWSRSKQEVDFLMSRFEKMLVDELGTFKSGKNDVTQAFQSIAMKVRNGLVEANDITESDIERELQTKITKVPCPDLLIRTSGEVRISNFLLWQLAYAELYFTNTLWPDFGEPEFVEALQSFQRRGRRFGGQ